jgi:RNA recognition motif-containing protein
MAYNPDVQQNLLYFYDLPKDKVTSVQLAKLIKDKTGIELNVPAQFKKDIGRYFDSAIVKIDKVENQEKFKEAC